MSIDLHCHVLAGIDDGPDSLEGSVALARAAVAAGTTIVVATPHVSSRYQNDPSTITARVDELNRRLIAEGVPLQVLCGAEIALARLAHIEPDGLSGLTLGAGRSLLVEAPFAPSVNGLDSLISDLQRQGYRVVLAHPERCGAFHRDRGALESLVHGGALTSITAGSLVGRFGARVRRFALGLVRDQLVHNVASDAHDSTLRPPGIAAELRQAGIASLAAWLTLEVPCALLEDSELTPRPSGDA